MLPTRRLAVKRQLEPPAKMPDVLHNAEVVDHEDPLRDHIHSATQVIPSFMSLYQLDPVHSKEMVKRQWKRTKEDCEERGRQQ